MIAETKKCISQVLEINRALAHDLDISHRDAAELARERDALLERVERLSARSNHIGEQLHNLGARLRQVEEERDDVKFQLDESVTAMEEIRGRLVNLPYETVWEEALVLAD